MGVDVVLIGHFARDRLVFPGVVESASGGGVYYGALALRRLGYAVAVVTKLHPDDFVFLDELRAEGISVHASAAARTTGIENIYPDASMDRRICRLLGFAGPFTPEEIPSIESRVTIITPLMAGEVPGELVRLLSAQGPVGPDAQGFARVPEGETLVTRDWPTRAADLASVTFLKADYAEAEALTGTADLRMAARALAALGPREVVLTHARGVLVYAGGTFFEAPFAPRQVRGRTGRGDTCFAAYVARRLETDPEEACRFAAAVTSLKMEYPGAYRGTRADVDRKITPRRR
ncbi:MAG: PfkB family carbohydrate kinase [Armatimonadota bacterium]|nr:PfkB family carbohydrate kinase [Armatimonadota bacterium]